MFRKVVIVLSATAALGMLAPDVVSARGGKGGPNAQQPSSITLSCNNTSKPAATAGADAKPDPITNVGIIVNLADRTVTIMDYVTPIVGITDTSVSFRGKQEPVVSGVKLKPVTIDGSIDRVTGSARVDWYHEKVGDNSSWELTCRPATRLF